MRFSQKNLAFFLICQLSILPFQGCSFKPLEKGQATTLNGEKTIIETTKTNSGIERGPRRFLSSCNFEHYGREVSQENVKIKSSEDMLHKIIDTLRVDLCNESVIEAANRLFGYGEVTIYDESGMCKDFKAIPVLKENESIYLVMEISYYFHRCDTPVFWLGYDGNPSSVWKRSTPFFVFNVKNEDILSKLLSYLNNQDCDIINLDTYNATIECESDVDEKYLCRFSVWLERGFSEAHQIQIFLKSAAYFKAVVGKDCPCLVSQSANIQPCDDYIMKFKSNLIRSILEEIKHER